MRYTYYILYIVVEEPIQTQRQHMQVYPLRMAYFGLSKQVRGEPTMIHGYSYVYPRIMEKSIYIYFVLCICVIKISLKQPNKQSKYSCWTCFILPPLLAHWPKLLGPNFPLPYPLLSLSHYPSPHHLSPLPLSLAEGTEQSDWT